MTDVLAVLVLMFATAEVEVGTLPSRECGALVVPTHAAFAPVDGFVGVRCKRTDVITSSPRPLPKPEGLGK